MINFESIGGVNVQAHPAAYDGSMEGRTALREGQS
jgi:hypothetical protein